MVIFLPNDDFWRLKYLLYW